MRAAERKVPTEMEAGEELLQRHERGGQGKCERENKRALQRLLDCISSTLGLLKKKSPTARANPREGLDAPMAMPRSS